MNSLVIIKHQKKKYKNSPVDIIFLEDENGKLHEDKTNLLNFINHLLLILKEFFREILLSNDKKKKEKTIDILKECYDNDLYKSTDLKEISKDTDSEIEVNVFINKESLEKDYDIFKQSQSLIHTKFLIIQKHTCKLASQLAYVIKHILLIINKLAC